MSSFQVGLKRGSEPRTDRPQRPHDTVLQGLILWMRTFSRTCCREKGQCAPADGGGCAGGHVGGRAGGRAGGHVGGCAGGGAVQEERSLRGDGQTQNGRYTC